MLKVEKASRTFTGGTTAFRDISFTANKGEIIGFLGTSGCGKSSLLRVISGLDGDHDGTVNIDGQVSEGVNENTGSIFQEPRLMPWLTVLDNVAFGLKGSKREKHEAAERLIRSVGLEGFENHYPKALSGGMAQRVAIARALVLSPDILLLDEPFSALDAFTKMQLQDLLLEIWSKSKPTLLLVTHDIDEALYLCDRILILRGQPGVLHREIKVDMPRPRSRGSRELALWKEEILKVLDLSNTTALSPNAVREEVELSRKLV
ncbi:MAG TPA: ABC transporter ATP-binding protein [Bacillales bacterium]|nr:ABC transporter ATP-binding protein [Bacillales bacterium]